MKYSFPQFKVQIENPTIEVDLNTIGDKAIDKLLSVDFKMITPSASFGERAIDMPYVDTWEDADVEAMVLNWLSNFQV